MKRNYFYKMNKKTLLCTLLLGATTTFASYAQTEPTVTVEESADRFRVETNKFWSNWFIGAGGGAQIYLGDHNKQMDFKDRISPAFNVYVGKWFTPGIGVRAGYSGHTVKGATQNGSHSTGESYVGEPHYLTKQKFDYNHYSADVLFNLTNLFCGYNPKHWFYATPYLGVGYLTTVGADKQRELGGSVGLLLGFSVCKSLDITLDTRATMVSDRFDGEVGGDKFDGIIATTLGLAYKFPCRGWGKSKTITKVYDNAAEIALLNNEINQLRADNEALKNQAPAVVAAPSAPAVVVSPQLIVFPIGKTTLSQDARVNIGFMAELIKANPGNKYVITGYADAQTGNKEINERLSTERARVVYDCFVNEYGISPYSLEYKGMGEVDNMFYDNPALSRATITQVKE